MTEEVPEISNENNPGAAPQLTYMPLPGDPEETVVGRLPFRAYEPVSVSDDFAHLISKLEKNAWFTSSGIDAERKDKWDRAKKARARANEARAEAEALEQG